MIKHNHQSHTFGESINPDVTLAKQVARKLKSNHIEVQLPQKTFKNDIDELKNLIGQTSGTMFCTSLSKVDLFRDLTNQSHFMIDGGFGELHRRQFLTKLLFVNSNDISGLQNKLLSSLTDNKPRIFLDSFYNNQKEKLKRANSENLENLN